VLLGSVLEGLWSTDADMSFEPWKLGTNNCLNCKWATFVVTNHKPPRIKKQFAGECLKATRITAPMASPVYGMEVLKNKLIDPVKPFLKCPTFEHKEE
jgi:hypothetical protein